MSHEISPERNWFISKGPVSLSNSDNQDSVWLRSCSFLASQFYWARSPDSTHWLRHVQLWCKCGDGEEGQAFPKWCLMFLFLKTKGKNSGPLYLSSLVIMGTSPLCYYSCWIWQHCSHWEPLTSQYHSYTQARRPRPHPDVPHFAGQKVCRDHRDVLTQVLQTTLWGPRTREFPCPLPGPAQASSPPVTPRPQRQARSRCLRGMWTESVM